MKRGKLNKNISLVIVIIVILLTAIAMYTLFKSPKEPADISKLTKQELLDMIERGELATTTLTDSGGGGCGGADIDGDGDVDMDDFNIFIDHWLDDDCAESNNWCGGADIDGDGDVDMSDYAILADNWGQTNCNEGDCDDGTPAGECSTLNPPLYCEGSNDILDGSDDTNGGSDDVYLVFDLSKCGADIGKCCESGKSPAGFATSLAVNIPESESCANAYTYFDEATIGGWNDDNFIERPGMAQVGGGYPTRVICSEGAFKVTEDTGVRYKSTPCIFTTWGIDTPGGLQEQVAILDWDYTSYAYCSYTGGSSVEAVEVQLA